jgi:hypothetical protein
MFVILNPSHVILSEAKNLFLQAQDKLREESHDFNKSQSRDSSAEPVLSLQAVSQ